MYYTELPEGKELWRWVIHGYIGGEYNGSRGSTVWHDSKEKAERGAEIATRWGISQGRWYRVVMQKIVVEPDNLYSYELR